MKNLPAMQESACNAGDTGSIPGSRRSPEEGNGNPLQYSCQKNPHGQRSLVGYSPWDRKELDMTEQLTLLCQAHVNIILISYSIVKSKKIMTAFPLKSGTRQGCSLLCDTIPSLPEELDKKKIKAIQIKKQE